MMPRPAAPIPSGNMLEMQISEPYSRPTESETLGWIPEICVLIGFLEDSFEMPQFQWCGFNPESK